jgi:hypothetical protein
MSLITPVSQPYRLHIVQSVWTQRKHCQASMYMLQSTCSTSWWRCIKLQTLRPNISWVLKCMLCDLIRLHYDHVAHVCTKYLYVWRINVGYHVMQFETQRQSTCVQRDLWDARFALCCMSNPAVWKEPCHCLSLQGILQKANMNAYQNAYQGLHGRLDLSRAVIQ